MARFYQSPEAMCPFYHMEEKSRIHCEGFAPGWSITIESEREAKLYKEDYCRDKWTLCPIARMLWAQYDDLANLAYMKSETANKSGLRGLPVRERSPWEELTQGIKESRP